MKKIILSRREFVKNTSLLTGSLMASPLLSRQNFFPAGNDEIKVAVIGCGGRGTGAAAQALSVKQNTKLVAMADAFRDNLDDCYSKLTGSEAKSLAVAQMSISDHGFKYQKRTNFMVLMPTKKPLRSPMW